MHRSKCTRHFYSKPPSTMMKNAFVMDGGGGISTLVTVFDILIETHFLFDINSPFCFTASLFGELCFTSFLIFLIRCLAAVSELLPYLSAYPFYLLRLCFLHLLFSSPQLLPTHIACESTELFRLHSPHHYTSNCTSGLFGRPNLQSHFEVL